MKKAAVSYLIAISAAFFIPAMVSADTGTLFNFYINSNAVYGLPVGSHTYTRLTAQGQAGQGTFSDCASPTYNLVGSGTTGPDITGDDFPVVIPSPVGAGYYTLCAFYYPSGNFTVVGQAELYFDGSSWATTQPTSIPFQNLYFPAVFSTSSAAIAASSSLWASMTLASSTLSCQTGNIFSDGLCAAVSYLFLPNPNILNAYAGLPFLIQTKFPFNWVASTTAIISGMSASSTANMIELKYTFAGSQISSSSPLALPNILPSQTVFSSSTIETYITPSQWAFFQTLIAAAIWLTFAADVFFTVRNKMHTV